MIIESHTLPLFPTVVQKIVVDYDFKELKETVQSLEYRDIETDLPNPPQVSHDFYLLDKHQKEKSLFKDIFDRHYKEDVFQYHNTDFKITTSWSTKTGQGAYGGHYHRHKNCMFCGVFYFDNLKTPIIFNGQNIIDEDILVNEPTSWNVYNSREIKIFPTANTLYLFPSYLQHRIGKNEEDQVRYSLAFNLFPVGVFGKLDSELK